MGVSGQVDAIGGPGPPDRVLWVELPLAQPELRSIMVSRTSGFRGHAAAVRREMRSASQVRGQVVQVSSGRIV
ncbi:hypothetical protein GCM10017778_00220 [Streptomyces vinaceus]|nr:hypothetical protein GCM10017778_00220 [Streptomyces vinaceus]